MYNINTLEETIPYVGNTVTDGELYDGQVWGDDGIDTSKAANHHHSSLKLPRISPSIVTNLTLLDYFLILFPMDYVRGTMLPLMNQRLPEGDPHVSENEVINWSGMWLVIGYYKINWGQRDWWSEDDFIIGRGSPFLLNKYMSRVIFEQILTRPK